MPKHPRFPQGFFMMPNDVFGTGDNTGWAARLGPIGFSLYSLIVRRYDVERETGLYESHASMARCLGVTEPTIARHLDRLTALGLVDRVRYGKRKHPSWVYVPRLPLQAALSEPRVNDSNTQTPWVLNTQMSGVIERGIPKLTQVNTQNDAGGETVESKSPQEDTTCSKGANILFNRLLICMSPEEQVTYVLEHISEVPLNTHVQIAWKYWCARWEDHYRSSYYPAKSKNPRVISKDKKNLRDKIEAVGLQEVIARMRRCFEVCDEMFPCVVSGKRIRPIMFNDFVNNRFFDQWIPMNREPEETHAKSADEKLQAAREKRRQAAGTEEAEKAVEVDG